MAQSGPHQKERLRILSWLIACAFFFTAASQPLRNLDAYWRSRHAQG